MGGHTRACDESHATRRPLPPLLGLFWSPHHTACAALICQISWAVMFWLPLCKWIGKPLISRAAVKNSNVSGKKKEILQGEKDLVESSIKYWRHLFIYSSFFLYPGILGSFHSVYIISLLCAALFRESLQHKNTKGKPYRMQGVSAMQIRCLHNSMVSFYIILLLAKNSIKLILNVTVGEGGRVPAYGNMLSYGAITVYPLTHPCEKEITY